MKRFISFALAAALAAACGDNDNAPIDAPDDGDAGVDASPTAVSACLDRPTDLPRPPTGTLPCELIPPGLTLDPGGSP